MAFSKTAIAKAEAQALSHFGVECRYHPAVSSWYKVIGGVVTPFDLRVPTDRSMRDWCRMALLQADYDEQQAKNAPNSANTGGGFWDTLLGDDDVRSAVHNVVPRGMKPFVNPLMDTLNGFIGKSGTSTMSATTAAVAKSGVAGAGGFMLGQAAGNSGIGGALGGAVGMALGGPVGAAIGAALMTGLESILVGAIKRTISNIAHSRDLGAESADNFSRGALSLTQNALDAGLQIGNTLLAGALRPFGASGNALAQFGAQLGPSVGRVIMSGLGIGAQGLRLAGGAAGLGMGVGGAALGGAAGFALTGGLSVLMHNPGMLLSGALGAILPALIGSLVGLIAVKVLNVITGVIGGVLDKLGQAFGELGHIAGGALKGIIDILGDVKRTALEVSQAVLSMSQNSGLSVRASSTAVNNLMGFGLAPQQTSQIFGDNVLMQSVKNVMFGTNAESGSLDHLSAVRNSYQGWKQQMGGNPMLANTMMESMGYKDLIPMANLPEREFRKSLDFSRGLEMPSGAVETFGQKIFLLENQVGQFATFIKTQLAMAFAPSFERGLSAATEFFKSHQREIISGIRDIGRWFFQLPSYAVDASILVVGGLGSISKGIVAMLNDFKGAKGPIFDFVYGFLSGLDKVINAVGRVSHGFQSMSRYAQVAAQVAKNPLNVYANARAMADAHAFAKRPLEQSHLAADFKDLAQKQTVTDKLARPFETTGKWADGWLPTLQGWQKGRFNRENMGREYDTYMSKMELPENEKTRSASDRRSFVGKRELNSNEFFTNEYASETKNEGQTNIFREQRSSLAQALERYSNYQRDIVKGGPPSLDDKGGASGFFGILDLLRAIVENTGREDRVKVDVNVGVSPQEDFLAKVLSYEQFSTWTALGGLV